MEFLGDVWSWFTAGEHWQGTGGVPHRLQEHVTLSALSMATAGVLALPLGLTLGHLRRGSALAINVSNIGRAIPSFAILVIALEVFGLGPEPAFVALVALAVPPMLTNAYVGIAEVRQDVRDAARGMGMTGWQLLTRVELPLGFPLVMAGVRTSTVQVIATATLAALIGEGGLGRYIIDGLATRDEAQVFAGGLLVALLAIVTEAALGAVERRVLPGGLREQTIGRPRERTSP